ncbi:hypothetical protein NVP1244A_093 [Vibrio phage 1.244.A._10N.261.54.C3]|nr:hypothetical protein NVP1244A_093 [Vibrio phage 1.244.A._10N.261.54.C3]AUR98721.1 hypothetical protein NVP1255O_093 [Vibrio phage 1.255.O._10N.286.45.F1]
MKKPNMLKFKPTVSDAVNRMDNEPLIAKDTGWFALSTDLDDDCPIIEYDLSGGFLGLLAAHGMTMTGGDVAAANIAVVDFADTVNTGAGIDTFDETGGVSGSLFTLSTSDLGAGEVAGRTVAASTDAELDNTMLNANGFGMAATTTLTITGLTVGKTIGVAMVVDGDVTVDGRGPDPVGMITTSFTASASDDIVLTAGTDAKLLGLKLAVLD